MRLGKYQLTLDSMNAHLKKIESSQASIIFNAFYLGIIQTVLLALILYKLW